MLIDNLGQSTGAISGGCLEDDVRRQAGRVIVNRKPKLLSYETTDDVTGDRKIKLGCNGKIHILLEPILPENENKVMHLFDKIVHEQKTMAVACAYSHSLYNAEQMGTNFFLDTDLHFKSFNSNTKPGQQIHNMMKDVLNVKSNQYLLLDNGENEVFIEYIKPPIALNIVGAGYDVLPLIKMAHVLGWHTKIISKRESIIRSLPKETARFTAAQPEDVEFLIQPNSPVDAFVLMSHNYEYDKAFLRFLIQKDLPYLGMLGPRSKLNKIKREFEVEQLDVSPLDWQKLHSPVGLNIGSNRAEEIAVAIIAEILATLRSN